MGEAQRTAAVLVDASVNLSVVRGATANVFVKCSPVCCITLDEGRHRHATKTIAATFLNAGLGVRCSPRFLEVAYGKLLVNLFNAVNALSGLSLAAMLVSRDYRAVARVCIAEALQVYRGASQPPTRRRTSGVLRD
jgi:ketopantoate reductase